MKFSSEEIEGLLPLNYAKLNFGKRLKYQIFVFQRGDIFLILTMLNLKDPLHFFFCFRTALLGGCGLIVLLTP